MSAFQANNLVLYKDRPALIKQIGDKVAIQTDGGKTVKVRDKDIVMLHPGPIETLANLTPQTGDIETAWELLQDTMTTVEELADLIYDDYTPATAWSAWQLVADGLYFRGTPQEITARTPEQVAQDQANRTAKVVAEQAWEAFIARVKGGKYLPEDAERLAEVEALAYSQRDKSRIMQTLGIEESPEKAHTFLLHIGYWEPSVNPYPHRMGLDITSPTLELPQLSEESRRDLTHLPAYAIDDEGSTDADDALSIEGDRLWVHVADAAALIMPDSPIDLEARARAATLYLPEDTVTMLPPAAAERLALGREEISPALSFGLDLDDAGNIVEVEIVPSWVRVTNVTYADTATRIEEEPFCTFYAIAQRNAARRMANEAIQLELPEVKVRVDDTGEVTVTPLPNLSSRHLVTEAMLMVGEATAQFAIKHEIPLAFSTQPPPEREPDYTEGLAGMFALRRTLNRSEMKSTPAPHSGLGLPAYVQATSPLRRYLDLVVHQQLRAFLQGKPLLDSTALLERVGSAAALSRGLRRAERQSRQHWTLVYLKQNPDWQGEAIIVEKWDLRVRILVPALAWESFLHLKEDLPLNTALRVGIKKVRLGGLGARFRLIRDETPETHNTDNLDALEATTNGAN